MQSSNESVPSGHLFIPKISFTPDKDPDPHKRRRKNIKKLKKVLKPKRSFPFHFLPAYGAPGQCCVTGINLRELPNDAYDKLLVDPQTFQPIDGRTLVTEFFTDAITGQPTTFCAKWNITGGWVLDSSYSPDLLQLYWLLTQWITDEERERQGTNGKFLKRRKITMNIIPISINRKKKPRMVDEIEPLFEIAAKYEGKGSHIEQYTNPLTGEVDLATITLDLRVMRHQESEALSQDALTTEGGEQV